MSFATYSLETETQLLLGGLESSEARQFLAAMPTVEQLMLPLSLDDLGVPAGSRPRTLPPNSPQRRLPPTGDVDRSGGPSKPTPTPPTARSPRSSAATTRRSPCTAGWEVGEIGGEFPSLPAAAGQSRQRRLAEQKRAKRRNMKEDNE
jgi:hypothetical protein